MKRFSKPLQRILTKMCETIGIDPKNVNFDEKDWFMKHEWTFEQQDTFRDWLANEIKTNKEIRNLFKLPYSVSKKTARQAADAFIFNHGWKSKKPVD